MIKNACCKTFPKLKLKCNAGNEACGAWIPLRIFPGEAHVMQLQYFGSKARCTARMLRRPRLCVDVACMWILHPLCLLVNFRIHPSWPEAQVKRQTQSIVNQWSDVIGKQMKQKEDIPLRIHCQTLGLDSLEVYLVERGSASKWPSKKSTW